MKNIILAASALALASALGACNVSSQVAAGLSTACGIATDLQTSPIVLNKIQSSALAVLVTTCANPPTNSVAISADVVNAVITLSPVVTAMLSSKKLTPAQAASATALLSEMPRIRAYAIQIKHLPK
jgi:hypothetical protein